MISKTDFIYFTSIITPCCIMVNVELSTIRAGPPLGQKVRIICSLLLRF